MRTTEMLWPDALPPGPTEEALGEAVLWATRMAVRKNLRGSPPKGMDELDLASELIIPTLRRTRKWREGKKTVREYAYMAACQSLMDYMRRLSVEQLVYVDVLDAATSVSLVDVGAEPSCDDVESYRLRVSSRKPETNGTSNLPLFADLEVA